DDLVLTLTALANCHSQLRHYDVAEPLYRRILALDRKNHGDRDPSVGHDLINLGDIALSLDRHAEAEALDRQALTIFESWYGENHPETASAMTILGRVLAGEARYDEAEGILRRGISIQ